MEQLTKEQIELMYRLVVNGYVKVMRDYGDSRKYSIDEKPCRRTQERYRDICEAPTIISLLEEILKKEKRVIVKSKQEILQEIEVLQERAGKFFEDVIYHKSMIEKEPEEKTKLFHTGKAEYCRKRMKEAEKAIEALKKEIE